MKDWELIRTVVAAHEADKHSGGRCTCPDMHRAIRAAKAFQRQFGTRTKPGYVLDSYNDKTGTWTTKSWMDADSTLLNGEDFRRLPKDVQQEKMRWLSQELDAGQARLEATMPGKPKRRSPRERKKEIVDALLQAPTVGGKPVFAASVKKELEDEAGKNEPVDHHVVERLAQRKLEQDARRQDAELGWS